MLAAIVRRILVIASRRIGPQASRSAGAPGAAGVAVPVAWRTRR